MVSIADRWKVHKHPMLGRRHSEESKLKMSNANTGRVSWNKGKKFSIGTRSKMREAKLGKPSKLKGITKPYMKGRINSKCRQLWSERFGTSDNPVIENPPVGYRFKPEAPFDMYYIGSIHINSRQGRRRVSLYGNNLPSKTMNFATFLHQIDLYKRTGKLIPKGMHVHHKDHNRMNDTYENLEGILPQEHDRIHARRLVFICPVDKVIFEKRICSNHDFTMPFFCSSRCQITFDVTLQPKEKYIAHRKWIAENQVAYIANHSSFVDLNLQDIIGKPISYGTWNSAPEAERWQRLKDLQPRTIEYINKLRDFLRNGYNNTQIGKELDTSQSNISQFIKRNRDLIYPL